MSISQTQRWSRSADAVSRHFIKQGALPLESSTTASERQLAYWTKRQRAVNAEGELSADRKEILDAISPDILRKRVARNRIFGLTLAKVAQYFAETGTFDLARSTDPEISRLSQWLYDQRSHYAAGSLAPERVQSLLAISPGILTSPVLKYWNDQLQQVQEVVQATGKVPTRTSHDPHVARLGNWIDGQRHRRGMLTVDQSEAMDAIHPNILKSKAQRRPSFDDRLAELAAFIKNNGRLPDPARSGEMDLGRWLKYHRYNSRNETQLNQILEVVENRNNRNSLAEAREALWSQRLRTVASFHETHGRLPRKHEAVVGLAPSWITAQRRDLRNGTMNPERAKAIEARLPGVLTNPGLRNPPRDDLWLERLGKVATFHAEHGRLPRESDPILGMPSGWVGSQRYLFSAGQLAANRVEAAQSALPQLFTQQDRAPERDSATWHKWLDVVAQFYRTNERLPFKSEQPGGLPPSWVATQRTAHKRGKMSDERLAAVAEKLPELFEKKPTAEMGAPDSRPVAVGVRWMHWLEVVAAFHQKHGALPRKTDRPDGLPAKWVSAERYKHRAGDLSAEQVRMIEAVLPELIESSPMERRDQRWNGWLDVTVEFHQTTGRLPHRNEQPEGLPAGWADVQRRKYRTGKLAPERIAAANSKLPELLAGVTPRA